MTSQKDELNFQEVEELLPQLFSEDEIPQLQELLQKYDLSFSSYVEQLTQSLLLKTPLEAHEKKFLEWARFSLAYKSQRYSPLSINRQWSDSTHQILKESWQKYFSVSDPIALASMGKLGSHELNLSSDIDLIFFSSESSLLGPLRKFIAECSSPQSQPTGYLIDLDLRPEGKASPLLVSPDRLGNHLWNQSDPWERYSYTRMKIELGNSQIKEKVEEIRDRFCYRKYLTSDFFPKFLSLRSKYHDTVKVPNHLKLSPGGIRDLELLTQTFQILKGGRNPQLRNLPTQKVLLLLSSHAEGLSKDYFKKLRYAYLVLRYYEGLLHSFTTPGPFYIDFEKYPLAEKAMNTVKKCIDEYEHHWNSQFKTASRPAHNLQKALELHALDNGVDPKIAANNFSHFFNVKSFKPYLNAISNQKSLKQIFLDLLCFSPFGCQILSRRPTLLDLFILRQEDFPSNKLEELLLHLSDLKMVQHILASLYFAKNKDLPKLLWDVSNSYQHLIKKILEQLDPEEHLDLLFLGKAAGNELGLKSDLDFVLISNSPSLPSQKVRSMFRSLSHPTPFGPLIPFDTRGGPQGQATPLSVSKASLLHFLENEAAPWQRLMYLKHRFFRDQSKLLFTLPPLTSTDQNELDDVLSKRLKVKDPGSVFFKTSPGGLFHCEFTFSNLYLKAGQVPSSSQLKDSVEELKLKFPTSEKDILALYENFIELRWIEQTWSISHHEKTQQSEKRVQNILNENLSLLKQLHHMQLENL